MKKLNEPEESFQKFFDVFRTAQAQTWPCAYPTSAIIAFYFEKAEHLYNLCKHKYAYYRFAMEVRHQT